MLCYLGIIILGVNYTAGNPQNDGFHSYTWDPNWGNPATIDSTSLTYDALGRMVEQQNGTTYSQVMYGTTGKVALMNGQTDLKAFQPLPGGGVIVHRPGSLTNYWRHADWLGTSRLAATLPGRTKFYDGAYAPFGEDYVGSGTTDLNFTGQDQDTITTMGGLYDFLYREYAPRQGRWISPDPAGLGAVDPTNPQSWNRYAYVMNNPTSDTDPLGLVRPDFNNALDFFASGGGGFIGGCTQDGIDSNCLTNLFLVAGGAAVGCPAGDCSVFYRT